MSNRIRDAHPPVVFALYLGGTVALIVISVLPSEVQATYHWQGAFLELVLLAGIYLGFNSCRLILIALGFLAAFGTLLIQSAPPSDVAATLWSLGALFITGLLLMPSMRRYTTHAVHTYAHSKR